jgi:hypothetical protein
MVGPKWPRFFERATNGQAARHISQLDGLERQRQRQMQLLAKALHLPQEQIASGKRINRPSDDPIGMEESLGYQETIAKIDQYDTNISDAQLQINSLDDILSSIYRYRDKYFNADGPAPARVQSTTHFRGLWGKLSPALVAAWQKRARNTLARANSLNRYLLFFFFHCFLALSTPPPGSTTWTCG